MNRAAPVCSSALDQAAQQQVGDRARLCDVGALGLGQWGVGTSTRGLGRRPGCPTRGGGDDGHGAARSVSRAALGEAPGAVQGRGGCRSVYQSLAEGKQGNGAFAGLIR